MKKILSILLSFVVVVSFISCGKSNTSNVSKVDKKGSLTVAIWDNNQLKGLQQIANEWGEKSGYDVEFEVFDWSTYWTMLEAGVSGGEMPDIFWMHSSYAQMYMDSNVLLNLNSEIAKDDAIDIANYYPGISNLYSNKDGHYAIPKDHDTIAVVYNKSIFDKYGIAYPTKAWTWEDFASIAQEITDKGKTDGVYGAYLDCGNNQSGWYNIIYAFGGEVINDDHTKSGMDNPNTIKAMNFVKDKILPACPSQDSMANTAGDTMLISNKLGMYIDGSWMVNSYYSLDNIDDLAWVELPWEDVNNNNICDEGERVSIYNGLGWSIYEGTENSDAAWSLTSALTSKEGQIKQSELGVTMSGYVGLSDQWASSFEGIDLSAYTDIENDGTLIFRPYSKYAGRWEDYFTEAFIPAWNGSASMTDTCKSIATYMNGLLDSENE